jgi:hypothetical protein
MSVIRPGVACRIERVEQLEQHVGLEARPALDADRVADPTQELDVRAAGETRAVADPQEMGAGVVPLAGQRILPGHRLLVRQSSASWLV